MVNEIRLAVSSFYIAGKTTWLNKGQWYTIWTLNLPVDMFYFECEPFILKILYPERIDKNGEDINQNKSVA